MTHDRYARVWTLTEDSARQFFGQPKSTVVVVLEERPTSERDIARYKPEAKLFGVRIPVRGCRCAGCTGKPDLQLVPGAT